MDAEAEGGGALEQVCEDSWVCLFFSRLLLGKALQ